MADHNEQIDSTRMTLGEHLEELRRRVIYALLGLAVAMGVALVAGNRIIGVLKASYSEAMRGEGFVVDKLVLSPDAAYRPAGEGPPASPRAGGAAAREAAPRLQSDASKGLVVVEAEAFDTETADGGRWRRVTRPGGHSGEGGVRLDPGDEGAEGERVPSRPGLGYRVRFARPGTYRVWVRGHPNRGLLEAPCRVGLDGRASAAGWIAFDGGSDWRWSGQTADGPVAAVEVPDPGEHTVNLWMREGPAEDRLAIPSVTAGFVTYFGVALVAGLVLASPWIFYQFWMFVSAGLYRRERRYVTVAVPFSAGLFVAGAAFFLFVASTPLMRFFIAFNEWLGVRPVIMLRDHIRFITHLMLMFGLAFQTPIVVLLLAKMGLVTVKTLNHYRRHVIVGVLILAALMTSPSPVDQVLLAVPMWLLYELGVLLAYLLVERKRKEPAA